MDRKKDTKELLADSMLRLCKTLPVNKVTVKEIVEDCGLSTQTFYNHFKDKYDLMVYIYESVSQALVQRMQHEDCDRHEIVWENLQFYYENRASMKNMLEHTSGTDSFAMHAAISEYEIWKKHLLTVKNLQVLPPDVDFDLRMFCLGASSMKIYWIYHCPEMSVDEFTSRLLQALPERLKAFFSE
ncbi:MAG: TetR family transcriptional regulator [Clostridia bacterium]|nr:TetR family transcriptional regulator [Clostridia bacterium]